MALGKSLKDAYLAALACDPVSAFGGIIALAGCFQGMQVESNSEEVGIRTTNAVVQAIFLIILFDAVFAVIYMELHI